jgi:hypothetical protein
MRNSIKPILLAFLGLAICQSAEAQNRQQDLYKHNSGLAGKSAVLPIGTSFEGRIQSTIGSTASKPGERFSIEVSAPVMANGTEVLIPTGSQIIGEVVEAIPSSRQEKDRDKRIKPLGKLRTQLMSLQMPSGMSYPIVASMTGEVTHSRYGTYQGLSGRKSSVAYVGSQSGFDAVNPALRAPKRNGQLAVIKKDELLHDPILGEDNRGSDGQKKVIRSLVKKGRDLYIYSGSPITIRLDAPLKLSYSASAGGSSIDMVSEDDDPLGKQAPKNGRRFSPTRERNKDNQQPEVQDLSGPSAVMGPAGGQGGNQTGSFGGANAPNSGNNMGTIAPSKQPGSDF